MFDTIFKKYEDERIKLHDRLVQLQAQLELIDAELKPLQKAAKLNEVADKPLKKLTSDKELVELKLDKIRFELQSMCQFSAALLSAGNRKFNSEAPLMEARRLIESSVLSVAVPSEAVRSLLETMFWRVYSLGTMNGALLKTEAEERRIAAEAERAEMRRKKNVKL